MSNHGNGLYDNLFASLISDIRSYNGSDPLLPWLRGVKKMKEALPPQLMKEKLPRFLQKCAEAFLTDGRYSNDMRYLRVWLQLLDFVDDPKAVLRTMEMNRIGMKKSLFYQAYALYYEKIKKFDAAERIYHMGVQNLAEPADELQKSYEQFLHRMQRHKNKRAQARLSNRRALNCKPEQVARSCNKEYVPETQAKFADIENEKVPVKEANQRPMEAKSGYIGILNDQLVKKAHVSDSVNEEEEKQEEDTKGCSEDTVFVKLVDSAIIGKSNAEDARHHGLVEPTINTREAMNVINSMFQQPLEPSIGGRARRSQSKTGNNSNTGFKVYSDESTETKSVVTDHASLKNPSNPTYERDVAQPLDRPFAIYVDSEEINDQEECTKKGVQGQKSSNPSTSSVQGEHASVFARPNDIRSECSRATNPRRSHQAGLWEDTVVSRFVGSTILEEPEVENVWHHGLVEPTINFKEAMNDINSMFGKPIEYARKGRSKKHNRVPDVKNNCADFMILPDDEPQTIQRKDDINNKSLIPQGFTTKHGSLDQDKAPNDMVNDRSGFLIFPDDEFDNPQGKSFTSSSTRKESDLFEQTMCTKEAIDEINKMFAMPMEL
ncbi:uncharacterized protein LOC127256490 isoform X2 [Andrographis paniculata]|uniref:uncharacterized protein LOC127256490 isoform X2 n=1 Tax=Andrographis paniculata TaxID=175694 RepID=UPI0021E9351F|nr:uncharacterized protein LOC127256490 isoform X2 [Andrographis paniculata]